GIPARFGQGPSPLHRPLSQLTVTPQHLCLATGQFGPIEARFALRAAADIGYPTQDGLEMLIRQGAIALAGGLHLSDGIPEEVVDIMRQAARYHLGL
ncbi:MAG: hypothetical protein ACFCU9_06545, partial [Cyanophyceae cyanobacterium]